ENPGTAAALYHRMTDADAIAVVQSSLRDDARLLFRRLATRSGPTRRSTLAEIIPFAEEVVDDILRELRDVGLVWPIQPPGNVEELAEVWWFVPRDVARVMRSVRKSNGATSRAMVEPIAGSRPLSSATTGLTPLEGNAFQAAPIAVATSILDRVLSGEAILAIMSDLDAERVRDVVHLGVALGVLTNRDRSVAPGVRSARWLALGEPERVRALTRIWSVDETDLVAVTAVIRRAILTVLRTGKPGFWYGANELARLAAAQTGIAPAPALSGAGRPHAGINRLLVDRAIVALGVLGTIAVALDARDRPTALRLTEAGEAAIR
ncbi:MAG TPA: hypothetical protein VKT80_05575, partial [Chloroflexota bacterium]|nr:hypothetical protein [Chloroflexota bacterium]